MMQAIVHGIAGKTRATASVWPYLGDVLFELFVASPRLAPPWLFEALKPPQITYMNTQTPLSAKDKEAFLKAVACVTKSAAGAAMLSSPAAASIARELISAMRRRMKSLVRDFCGVCRREKD